jgi:UDP-N-acetylmuramoylalanine--D-glutamate ligase
MIDEWRASGKPVAVVGLARSGIAATLLLRERGVPVYASDAAPPETLADAARRLRDAGADVELGRHDLGRIAAAGAVVISPGIPPDAPPLVTAREAGVPVHAEVDLGFTELRDTRAIAVTGTNGKTTTTSLVAHLLGAAGVRAEAAGNIGRPLCEMVRTGDAPAWLALELSSFQLHDAPHIAPAVGVLTNLAPNHLDRYQSLEEYYGDKARLFVNAEADSVWVTNADDPAVETMAREVPGSHLRFSTTGRSEGWFDRANSRLMLGEAELLRRDQLRLLGDHNVANALAAALAVGRAGVDHGAIAAGLRTFRAIPHRLEPIAEVDRVLWINDSKSTNVTSTEVAIAALDRPFVLLLGGRHKGEPYTRLAPLLRGRCRAVIAYGEAQPLIVGDLGRHLPVVSAETFNDVLTEARRLARPGDAVLLSPACSSFDMFENYEQRGDQFRAAVEAMR